MALIGRKTTAGEPERAPHNKLYVGFETGEDGEPTGLADAGPHTLVLAGPGAGKSRRVLVPGILLWDGPVVAVSAKSDLAEMSAEHRARRGGPLYVMDLTGQADWDAIPDHAVPVVNDPCALLVPDADGSTDDSALDLANLLLQVGTLGMGGGQGGGGDSAFWMTLAQRTLACLLQAGGWYPDPEDESDEPRMIWGGGIDWVLRAAIDMGDIDGEGGDEDADEFDHETPNWDVAALRAAMLGSSHADEIAATKLLDSKQRDSVSINLRVALASWQKRAVRGKPGAQPFSPELLEDPNATFYLVSPSSGSAAGAATSIIESIVAHWTQHSIVKGLPAINMVIDECPQICPIPRLPEHVALMRSYRCHFTIAAQNSAQFKAKLGEANREVLLNAFSTVLIGVGAIEKEIIEQAAWTVKPTERRTASFDSHSKESQSTDRVERHGAELLPEDPSEGRLLIRGREGMKVLLKDYSQMLAA